MTSKKSRLGRGMEDIALERGLDYLLNEAAPVQAEAGRPLMADLKLIDRNPDQPRIHFDEKKIASLAQSVKSMGIIDPLTVRLKDDGRYELVDGERRLRAAIMANLEKVPVIIVEKTEDQAEHLSQTLVHNLCREDLNPIEEAETFARLEKEFDHTHQEIAEIAGRERSSITNAVRLLKLPEYIKDDIRYGRLTPGHGRALLALVDQGILKDLREDIIIKKMPVRQVENLIKRLNKNKKKNFTQTSADDNVYFEALATALSRGLQGLKVKIVHQGRSGKLEIFYNQREEFEWLMAKLGVGGM